MLLKKITLDNIRSYKHQGVEFPNGSILLAGDIGSGKTSILLAIEFALFGLQPGQRGSSLLRQGEQKGMVKIEFEIDGKIITIERTLKKAKTISQDYCSISIDGEKRETSVLELKDKVLEILNYPKEFAKKQNLLYKFTVYTPQEEMKQIILEDAETRVNTLRHIFGIDKYKTILENVSLLTLKMREEKRIKEGITMNLEQDRLNFVSMENELEIKQRNLLSIEKELFMKTEIKKRAQEEKDEISKKIEEKNRLKQEVEKARIMLMNKKETLSNNIKNIDKIKIQIEELQKLDFDEERISLLEKETSMLKKEKEKFNEKNLEISSQINSIFSKNEELRKLEQKISNLEMCPTCLQNIGAIYRANILNKIHSEITENNKELEVLEYGKKQASEKIREFSQKILSKEEDTTDLRILKIRIQGSSEKQNQLHEIEEDNNLLKKEIEILDNNIEKLGKSVFELERFDEFFKLKNKEFEEVLKQERIVDIKVAELKKEIEVFSRQIDSLREKIKKTEEIYEQLKYLNNLEDWLSKKFTSLIFFIEANIMASLKTKFSQLFAEWFYMLVPGSFEVRLSDNFTPIIEQQDYEIDYAYLSGGERTAVALAYRLSLNQVINSLLSRIKTRDFIILDEPTDGFSDQQLDKIRDVLQELNVKQLIIVSHEQKIEGFVENVLRFKKENGISFLES